MRRLKTYLIILPVRNAVLFPGVVLPIAISGELRARGRAGSRAHPAPGRPAAADRSASVARMARAPKQLHRVGTAATIVRFITAPDGTHHLICPGRGAIHGAGLRQPRALPGGAHRSAQGTGRRSIRRSKRAGSICASRRIEAVQLLPQAPGELVNAIRSIESIPALADMVASFMDLKTAEKQEILATFDLKTRLDRVLDAARPAHRGAEGVAPDR